MNSLLACCLAAACCCPLYGHAGQDAAPAMPEAPVAAEIAFTPFHYSFVTHIDDAVLRNVGCTYAVREPALAARLAALIVAARDMPQDAVDPKQSFEVRNKVVLHFAHGPDVALAFSQAFSDVPYLVGTWDGAPIRLRTGLVKQVHELVRDARLLQVNAKASEYCE